MSNRFLASSTQILGFRPLPVYILVLLFGYESVLAAPSRPSPVFELECGRLENAYGPYDYTNPADVRERLPIVERFHFNQEVESLVSGQTGQLPGGDLAYTLRAFPNHHRALYAMVKYILKNEHQRIPPGADYPGECYLMRAVRFNPKDVNVRIIYGIYLSSIGRENDALVQYEEAEELAPNNAEVHYNLGLLYRKLHRLDAAVEHARIAYRLGYPLQGLKNQLKEDGVWTPDTQEEVAYPSKTPGVE